MPLVNDTGLFSQLQPEQYVCAKNYCNLEIFVQIITEEETACVQPALSENKNPVPRQ